MQFIVLIFFISFAIEVDCTNLKHKTIDLISTTKKLFVNTCNQQIIILDTII